MTNDRKVITLDDLERRGIHEHRKPYFDWIRQIVSLSTAALTALIALQTNYLPSNPKAHFLLALCWGALVFAIILGIFALSAEHKTPLLSTRLIRNSRVKIGDDETIRLIASGRLNVAPSVYHYWAVRLMAFSFASSLVLLCIFAIVNI